MKTIDWTYELFAKQVDSRVVHPRTYEDCEENFNATLTECGDDLVQVRAALFDAFYPALALNSVRLAVTDPKTALVSLHLMWRLKAISLCAYLEFVHRKFQKKARPRVRPLGIYDINDLLMLAASADVLGIEDASRFFAIQAFELERQPATVVNPQAFCSGPVEPFMFNLCSKHFGFAKELAIPRSDSAPVFLAVEESWRSSGITAAIEGLLDLKCSKMLSENANDDLVFGLDTGINFFVPFESLFIQRVREGQGIPTKLPDHAIVKLPICSEVYQHHQSGANSHVSLVLETCRQLLPGFTIPWEKRFEVRTPTEFRDVLVSV